MPSFFPHPLAARNIYFSKFSRYWVLFLMRLLVCHVPLVFPLQSQPQTSGSHFWGSRADSRSVAGQQSYTVLGVGMQHEHCVLWRVPCLPNLSSISCQLRTGYFEQLLLIQSSRLKTKYIKRETRLKNQSNRVNVKIPPQSGSEHSEWDWVSSSYLPVSKLQANWTMSACQFLSPSK